MHQNLIERERELAIAAERLDAACAGMGGAILVEGPAGIGTSALLAVIVSLARERGMRVACVDGRAPTGGRPLAMAEQWLYGLAGTAPSDVGAALFRLADETPVVLAVDDVHAGADASLALAAALAARFRTCSGLIVAGARSTGSGVVNPAIGALARAATVIRPRPLSVAGTAALLSRELRVRVTEEVAAVAASVTAGTPRLLVDLAAEIEQVAFDAQDGPADALRQIGERVAARSVRERLAPIACGDVAEIVALLEPWAAPRRLARLLSRPVALIHHQLDDLVAIGLLSRADRPTYARRWERDAVVRTASLVEAQRVRTAAAALLCADGESVGAGMLLLDVDPASDAARCVVLRRAATSAQARERPDLAIALLRRLLAEPVPPALRTEALVALGTTQVRAGQAAGVDTLRNALNDAVQARDVADASAALGWALAGQADGANAAQTLLEARARLDTTGDVLDIALDVQIAETTAWDGGLKPARRAVLARLAQAVDSPLAGSASLAAQAVDAIAVCRPAGDVLRLCQLALANGRLADTECGVPTALSTAMLLGYSGRADLGIDQIDHTISRLRAHERSALLRPATAFRGALKFMLGRLAEAEQDLRAILASPWLVRSTPLSAGFLVLCRLERGDDEGAAAVLRDLDLEGGDLQELIPHAPFLYARGELRARRGDPHGALDDLRACGRRLLSGGWTNPTVASWRGAAARVLWDLGEHDEAEALADEEVRLAEMFAAPAVLSRSLRSAAGTVPADRGRTLLDRAAKITTGPLTPLERVAALIDLAAIDLAGGAAARARPRLHTALALARQCAAEVHTRRAAELLSAAGGRATGARTSLGGLTRAECRVAQLAAEGRTNAEISIELVVSRKTVETHLSAVFRKLAITSRGQLSSALDVQPADRSPT